MGKLNVSNPLLTLSGIIFNDNYEYNYEYDPTTATVSYEHFYPYNYEPQMLIPVVPVDNYQFWAEAEQ